MQLNDKAIFYEKKKYIIFYSLDRKINKEYFFIFGIIIYIFIFK